MVVGDSPLYDDFVRRMKILCVLSVISIAGCEPGQYADRSRADNFERHYEVLRNKCSILVESDEPIDVADAEGSTLVVRIVRIHISNSSGYEINQIALALRLLGEGGTTVGVVGSRTLENVLPGETFHTIEVRKNHLVDGAVVKSVLVEHYIQSFKVELSNPYG